MRVRELGQNKARVRMCDLPRTAQIEYDLVIFYQDQSFLKKVKDTPLPRETSTELIWKGDILVMKVERDGEQVYDLYARDISDVEYALLW